MKCQAMNSTGHNWHDNQCSREGKIEIPGELVNWNHEPQSDFTACLCKLHVNQLNRTGTITIYTDNGTKWERNRTSSQFRAKDRSAYEALSWQRKYQSARSSAYYRVTVNQDWIERVARRSIQHFIALVADGTPIPGDVVRELRSEILKIREELAASEERYARISEMGWEQYRAEQEAKEIEE